MDFRDIWLIAFIVYLGLCLLIEAVYPVCVRKKYALKDEHAQWFWAYKHFFLYIWSWFVAASLFMLFWDISDFIRPVALFFPFLMVYAGARIGRRNYRISHGTFPDNRAVGMPKIYAATLGALSKPLRFKPDTPDSQLVRETSWSVIVGAIVFALCALIFLLSLTDFDISPTVTFGTIVLAIGLLEGLWAIFVHTGMYTVFTPHHMRVSKTLGSARNIPYRDIIGYRVIPKNPDDLNPDAKQVSQWKIELQIPWGTRSVIARNWELQNPHIEYLTRQIAFRVEQERWADENSPADRERLDEYRQDARLVCTTKGYIPAGKYAQEAANRASFKQTH